MVGPRNDDYCQGLRIASYWCGGFHRHPRSGHEHERVPCTHQQQERARKCRNRNRVALDKVQALRETIDMASAEIATIMANAKAYDAQLHPYSAPDDPEPPPEPPEQLELEPIAEPKPAADIDPNLLAAVLAAVTAYHAGRTP